MKTYLCKSEEEGGNGRHWVKARSCIGLPCVDCGGLGAGSVNYGSEQKPAHRVFCADCIQDKEYEMLAETHMAKWQAERE